MKTTSDPQSIEQNNKRPAILSIQFLGQGSASLQRDFLDVTTHFYMCGAPNYIHIGDRLAGAQPAVTGVSQAEDQAKVNHKTEATKLEIDYYTFKDKATIGDRCVIRINKVIEVIVECLYEFGNNDCGFA